MKTYVFSIFISFSSESGLKIFFDGHWSREWDFARVCLSFGLEIKKSAILVQILIRTSLEENIHGQQDMVYLFETSPFYFFYCFYGKTFKFNRKF